LGIGAYFIFDYFGSWFADQRGKRLAIEIGLFFQLFYLGFAYLANDMNIYFLYSSFIAYGLSRAFYGTADLVYDHEILMKEKISYAQFKGNLRSFMNLGFFGSTALGTYIFSNNINHNYILLISLIMILIAEVSLRLLPCDKVKKEDRSQDHKKELKEIKDYIKNNKALFLAGILFGMSHFIVELGLFQILGTEIKIDEALLGKMSSLLLAGGVLSAIFIKFFLSTKFTKRQLLRISLIAQLAAILSWMTMNIYIIAASFLFHALFVTLYWSLFDDIFFNKIPKNLKARLTSIRWMFAALLGIFFNQLCAYIVTLGPSTFFPFISTSLALVLILAFVFTSKSIKN